MPKVTVTGMENHHVANSGPDVNGKWGGHLAWVVSYQPNDNPDKREQQLELYCHIGNYWDVGKCANTPGCSKMNVFTALRGLLDGEMSIRAIINFAKMLYNHRKHR